MVVGWNVLQKSLLVFLLASIIIISLGSSRVLADNDDKDSKQGKSNDDKGKAKDHGNNEEKDDQQGGSSSSTKEEKSGENGLPDGDKGKADGPKGEKSDPQQSPPPQQSLPEASSSAPAESPVFKELGKNESDHVSIEEQRAVSDSLAVNDVYGKTSASAARPVHDSIATGESIASQSAIHLARSISESLTLGDSDEMAARDGSSGVSVDSELRLLDHIATSGLVVAPVPPRISVTSPPVLHVLDNQDAEILFHSTAAGTYSIAIRNAEGASAATLEGNMLFGANSVSWDGKESGSMVPAGDYIFYITAKSAGGVRNPPAEGDGSIVVAGPAETPAAFQPLQDAAPLLTAISIIVAAMGVLLYVLRRKKSLTFYLPPEAAQVVDDIRGKYPDAKLEDYIQPAEEGVMQRYTGVTIQNPKDVDDGWLASIAEKVKNISGAESVNVNFRGKTHIL